MIQNNFNKIILNYLQNNSNHAFKKKEIANNLCIKSKYYPQFRNDLKSLTKNGLITKIHGGRFIYTSIGIYLIGILSINRSGLGFVNSKNKVVLDWPRPRALTENGWYPSYRFHQPDLERRLRGGKTILYFSSSA